jgi:putative flavoprotein involved in K+ transport
VLTRAAVETLTQDEGGYVAAIADGRRFMADNVVVATGVFRKPYTPEFAQELHPAITQLHSNEYRNPAQLQDGPVLVVGASHSGSDIAYEVAASHQVVLSGTDTGQLPVPIESRRGRVAFRLLVLAGTHVLTVNTPLGRKLRPHVRHGGGPLLRYRKKDLRAAGVDRAVGHTVGVEDGLPMLSDGRVIEVRNVIWCTGFRPDFGWIKVPVEFGEDGYPVQLRGAAASSPGLYFAGLPFLHSFASMFITGSARDSGGIARQILGRHVSAVDRTSGGPFVPASI